jgi:K+-sensing histidine kinase KdpD
VKVSRFFSTESLLRTIFSLMRNVPLIGLGRPRPAAQIAGLAVALLGTALATVAGQIIALRWGGDAVVLLYLVPVLAAAIFGGVWSSSLTAVAAALCYNFFFTEPLHTLFVRSPASLVTVVLLFLVGLVTSALAGSLREQAILTAAHASRNATIAGFAQRLLSCGDEKAIFDVAAAEVGRLFGCRAVLIVDDGQPCIAASVPPEHELAPSDIAVAAQAIASGAAAGWGVTNAPNLADWQFHPVPLKGSPGVAIGLAREDGAPPVDSSQSLLLVNLLDQTALAVARARADQEARNLMTLRQRDGMRDALLSSVGRDIKPSINAIAAAGRALKRAGEGDRSLVASIVQEASKLDRYVDNLTDLLPAEAQKPVVVGDVTIDLHNRQVRKADRIVGLAPKEYDVLAELAKHGGRVLTHGQLLRAVWGPAQQHQVEYLRVAIGALRRKLEDRPSQPALILNEPAVGYRLAITQ